MWRLLFRSAVRPPMTAKSRRPKEQVALPWLLPAARPFHHPDEPPSFPAERSFGVRAACCRFPSASLLAAVSSRKLSCGNLHPRLGLYSHSFPATMSARQRAGWRKSGSKLHALQSFAPYAHGEAFFRIQRAPDLW